MCYNEIDMEFKILLIINVIRKYNRKEINLWQE